MDRNIKYCLIYIIFAVSSAYACDPCALYNAAKLQGHTANSIAIALSEQYTNFDSIDPNAEEYTKGFNISALSANYDFSDQFGVQLNIPYITEKSVNLEGTDYESGIGDISIGGNYSPVTYRTNEHSAILSFYGSIKLPTGDTGNLNNTDNHHTDKKLAHTINGASGGKTLTIGSGSVDYILGTSFSGRLNKILWLSSFQYAIRTEGDYNYKFDNDIVWNAGPGAYLVLKDEHTLALRAVLSGEHKGEDTKDGNDVAGSKLSNLYLGPELIGTINRNWLADLSLDFPVDTDKSNSELIPDWRIRSSISYRF